MIENAVQTITKLIESEQYEQAAELAGKLAAYLERLEPDDAESIRLSVFHGLKLIDSPAREQKPHALKPKPPAREVATITFHELEKIARDCRIMFSDPVETEQGMVVGVRCARVNSSETIYYVKSFLTVKKGEDSKKIHTYSPTARFSEPEIKKVLSKLEEVIDQGRVVLKVPYRRS